MHLIPELGIWKKKDCEIEDSLGYIVRLCLKKHSSSCPPHTIPHKKKKKKQERVGQIVFTSSLY
jgi:hypothetical protein